MDKSESIAFYFLEWEYDFKSICISIYKHTIFHALFDVVPMTIR